MNMKTCKHCNETKELKEFSRNNLTRDGFLGICKKCYNIRSKKFRQERERMPPTEMSGLKLTSTTLQDWCDMYKFLEKIGYDLERNIHEQFCEKKGLKLKKKPRENVISYSVAECKECWNNPEVSKE